MKLSFFRILTIAFLWCYGVTLQAVAFTPLNSNANSEIQESYRNLQTQYQEKYQALETKIGTFSPAQWALIARAERRITNAYNTLSRAKNSTAVRFANKSLARAQKVLDQILTNFEKSVSILPPAKEPTRTPNFLRTVNSQ